MVVVVVVCVRVEVVQVELVAVRVVVLDVRMHVLHIIGQVAFAFCPIKLLLAHDVSRNTVPQSAGSRRPLQVGVEVVVVVVAVVVVVVVLLIQEKQCAGQCSTKSGK